jgi:hypothetical protein
VTQHSEMTDVELLHEVAEYGERLLSVAKDRQAAEGSTTDDPRWASPLPLRFEVQLATLFLGALDAHEVTSNVLRNHQMHLGASLAASARARPVGTGPPRRRSASLRTSAFA